MRSGIRDFGRVLPDRADGPGRACLESGRAARAGRGAVAHRCTVPRGSTRLPALACRLQ